MKSRVIKETRPSFAQLESLGRTAASTGMLIAPLFMTTTLIRMGCKFLPSNNNGFLMADSEGGLGT